MDFPESKNALGDEIHKESISLLSAKERVYPSYSSILPSCLGRSVCATNMRNLRQLRLWRWQCALVPWSGPDMYPASQRGSIRRDARDRVTVQPPTPLASTPNVNETRCDPPTRPTVSRARFRLEPALLQFIYPGGVQCVICHGSQPSPHRHQHETNHPSIPLRLSRPRGGYSPFLERPARL